MISLNGESTSRTWNRRRKFERLPNVVPVADIEDEPVLLFLIRRIKRGSLLNDRPNTWMYFLFGPLFPWLSLKKWSRTKLKRLCVGETTTNIYHSKQETKSSTKNSSLVNRWQETNLFPLWHVRYCREKKAVFANFRNRRQDFDETESEKETRWLNFIRTKGRSLTRRFRSPSLYCRPRRSPNRWKRKAKLATFQTGKPAFGENPQRWLVTT